MYIIVVGGGEIGFYLTKTLLNEGHEVLMLERDGKRCEALAEEVGKSSVMHGDGCEATTLEDAGMDRADMLIAVTGDDEDNLVACQVAKHKFAVNRVIARIKNPKNEAIFGKLGIDVTVSSTDLILAHIEREFPTHPLTPLLKLKGEMLEVVGIKIPPHSKVMGKQLKDITLPTRCLVALVITEKKGAQVPTAYTTLKAGNEVIAVVEPEAEEELRIVLTSNEEQE